MKGSRKSNNSSNVLHSLIKRRRQKTHEDKIRDKNGTLQLIQQKYKCTQDLINSYVPMM